MKQQWRSASIDWRDTILTPDRLEDMTEALQEPLELTINQHIAALNVMNVGAVYPMTGYFLGSNDRVDSRVLEEATPENVIAMGIQRKSFQRGLDILCPPDIFSRYLDARYTRYDPDSLQNPLFNDDFAQGFDQIEDTKSRPLFAAEHIPYRAQRVTVFTPQEVALTLKFLKANPEPYMAYYMIGRTFKDYVAALKARLPKNSIDALYEERSNLIAAGHIPRNFMLSITAPAIFYGRKEMQSSDIPQGMALARRRAVFRAAGLWEFGPTEGKYVPTLCPAQGLIERIMTDNLVPLAHRMRTDARYDLMRAETTRALQSIYDSTYQKHGRNAGARLRRQRPAMATASGCPFHNQPK